MGNRHWTERDIALLMWNYGVFDLDVVAKRLDRTEDAVKCKITELGIGKHSVDGISLKELARISGYHADTILRVARESGIRIPLAPVMTPGLRKRHRRPDRRSAGIRYAIDDETRDRLLAVLVQRDNDSRTATEWGGSKPDCCQRCGRSDRKYRARGLCRICYNKAYERGEFRKVQQESENIPA